MAKISYALILSDTLKLKQFQVTQVEAVIDITGDYDDPSSLQVLRDAVNQSFQDRRANLNKFIKQADDEIARVSDKRAKLTLLSKFNSRMGAAVGQLEKGLQGKVAEWIKQKQAAAHEEVQDNVKFWVKCGWSGYKAGKGISEAVTGSAAAVATGGTTLALAAKGLFDTGKEVLGLIADLRDHFKGEAAIRQEIEKSRAAIKAAKGRPTESVVGRLEMQLKAYSPKISAIEASARTLGVKLEQMLDTAEKGGKELATACAPSIDKVIKEIIALNEGVKEARDIQKRASDALRDAQKKAVKDPASFLGFLKWCDGVYEQINLVFDYKQIDDMEQAFEFLMDQVVKKYTA